MVNPAAGQSQSISDPLFKTQDQELAQKWDAVQTCQVDFAFNQEVAVYYSSEEWQNAKSVLDLGSGNGYYLERISSQFPDKEYVGIDKSTELIAIAGVRCQLPNVRFSSADVLQVVGSYDFVIMRLFLQHLKEPEDVLRHVAQLVKPGGSVFIIDSNDLVRIFNPEVPEFLKFFQAYKEQQTAQGFDRNVATNLFQNYQRLKDWTIGHIQQIVIPSTVPGNLDLFRKYYTLMIQIVERAGQLTVDFQKVKAEWESWCGLEKAFTQVGLKIIRLDRI